MSAREDFTLPELPPGCLKCGRVKPVSLYKVQYRCTGGNVLTGAALLLGALVMTTTTYVMRLPLCASCAAYRRYKALVMLLMVPVVGGFFVLSFYYGLLYPVLFALPIISAVVMLVWAAVFQSCATPKTVRLSQDTLVLDVPGRGHLTLASPEVAARTAAPQPRGDSGPRLKRSLCPDCGFINFAGAVECKKCRAALTRGVAV
ncbi:MAG TPA: hypothetical protein VF736_23335 [Pyrinomonadaceae bacterium]|jgi:hypothetical protein